MEPNTVMKWRIIINMSLTGDTGSALGNAIKPYLKQCGITPIKQNAHSWEGTAVSPVEAAEQLKRVIDCLADPQHCGKLDDIWIYIDRAKDG